MSDAPSYKIVVLGAGAVGKSAITIRFVADEFRQEYDPTIEDSFNTQIIVDKQDALLDILDTAGQEQFAALQDHWIREAQAFILVYSINSLRSFKHAEDLYIKITRNKEGERIYLVLVGNKSDLPENERQVPYDTGKELASQWQCPFFETSAKSGDNIRPVFENVVRLIRLADNNDNEDDKDQNENKNCCLLM